jgi:hypothetical protein
MTADAPGIAKEVNRAAFLFRCHGGELAVPAAGFDGEEQQLQTDGQRVLDAEDVVAGPDASTWTFVKTETRQNLYRIPLR